MKKFSFLMFVFIIGKILNCEIIFDFEENPEGWESVTDKQIVEVSQNYAFNGNKSLVVKINQKKEVWIKRTGDFDWADVKFLSFYIYLPEESKIPVNFICYIKDKEWNWFETSSFFLRRGEEKKITLDLTDESEIWKSKFHLLGWDGYVRQKIKEFGIKFFFPEEYTGLIYLDCFSILPEKENQFFLYNYRVNSSHIKQFEKFEISFDLPIVFQNPFDPEIIDIKGVFNSPSGEKIVIPAFFSQNYIRYIDENGEILFPYGKKEWKIRFTPIEIGKYRYEIQVNWKGDNFSVNAGDFEVIKGEKKGFIKWNKKDKKYLSFDNGDFFYPVGHSIRSSDDTREPYPYDFEVKKGEGTFSYDRYFPKMHENSENYTRIWMAPWWVGIEWNPSYSSTYEGLGKYNLENSWKLDYLLELANKNDIYLILTLINHGQFSINPDAEWWDNPYNILNGGFLLSPDEFFINEKAEKFFKNRLRYIVSRWAYSPNIVFWELWNEIDLTGYYDTEKVRNWHKRIVPYLKSIDPWKHLITTHYCRISSDPYIWIIPELETIVGNAYNSAVVSAIKNFYLQRKSFEKPIMINEFGVGKNKTTLENNLHAGIWASSLTPMFGTALFWWWPFIDNYNLYYHYKSLSNFLKNIDRIGKELQLSNAIVESSSIDKNQVDVIGIQNNIEGYFWVYDKKLFDTLIFKEKFEKIKGAKLNVKGLFPGKYKIEFWDTYKGEMVYSTTENLPGVMILPEFEKDIAIKIKK